VPPSPWALPVFGHLHHVTGAPLQRAMCDPASRHGPLVLLWLGRLPVVVASSADVMHEVMCFPGFPQPGWSSVWPFSRAPTASSSRLMATPGGRPARSAPSSSSTPGVSGPSGRSRGGNPPPPPRRGICATSAGSELSELLSVNGSRFSDELAPNGSSTVGRTFVQHPAALCLRYLWTLSINNERLTHRSEHQSG
jgi:hypothetical protein